jgi:dihydrofolate reductase
MAGVLDANPSRPTRSIHMAVVISEMSMSLDGFVADPADQVGPLFDWYANGEVEVPTAVPERWTFRTSEASAGYLRETMGRIGALVAGRRLFDIGRWGEHGHPYGVPVFVVTHDVPQGWPREDAPLPITFVTDGVEHVVAQAKTTAGEGWVGVAGPNIAQQCRSAQALRARPPVAR